MLRKYQQCMVDALYMWWGKNKGNVCLVMPTGSGKSHIIAHLCKVLIQGYPEVKLLMLTHVRELIQQNAEKMRQHWPNAPMGIYSAGLGQRELGEPITFAGIQSVRSKAEEIGWIDIVFIDEAHLVGHDDAGGYRKLLNNLKETNTKLRVVGLTATPYRLGHGLITDAPAIFDDLIDVVSIEELIAQKFLSPLRSKMTNTKIDVSDVHTRGGEYVESELQAAVAKQGLSHSIVAEVIERAKHRKSWLFFCVGVSHAIDVASKLYDLGIKVRVVDAKTTKADRDIILSDFKSGKIQAITNCSVLTTGFDHPGLDMIALLRPTKSPGLYIQMAGRGMRTAEGKTDCLVLDFAGLVEMHGPVTAVRIPKKKGDKAGIPPMKPCPDCNELLHISIMLCPACGHEFEASPPESLKLRNDDIMGTEAEEAIVIGWSWVEHTSRGSGKQMLECSYLLQDQNKPIREYFCVTHEGYAGEKAIKTVGKMAKSAGVETDHESLVDFAIAMEAGEPPNKISFRMDGKYHRVLERQWKV